MAAGQRNQLVEWAKWLIFKLGTYYGFTSKAKATMVGIASLVLGALTTQSRPALESMLSLMEVLRSTGVTSHVLDWVFRGIWALAIANMFGCWCRVAVLCMPTVFDRYKIHNVGLLNKGPTG